MTKIRLLMILFLCFMPNVATTLASEAAEALDVGANAMHLPRGRRLIRLVRELPARPFDGPRQTARARFDWRATTRLRRTAANKQLRKVPVTVGDALSDSENH